MLIAEWACFFPMIGKTHVSWESGTQCCSDAEIDQNMFPTQGDFGTEAINPQTRGIGAVIECASKVNEVCLDGVPTAAVTLVPPRGSLPRSVPPTPPRYIN